MADLSLAIVIFLGCALAMFVDFDQECSADIEADSYDCGIASH